MQRKNRTFNFPMTLAMALAVTGVASITLPIDPAHAQRVAKKDKNAEKAPEMELSNEFRTAFSAAQTAFAANDFVTAEARLNEATAIAVSGDEKNLTGKMMLQIGLKTSNDAMQIKGLELALSSGKTTPEESRTYNSFVGEKALLANDFPKARQYLKQAIDAGQSNPVNLFQLAEAHFGEAIAKSGGRNISPEHTAIAAQGLPFLKQAVEGQLAGDRQYAGTWAKRGFQIARATKSDPTAWANLLLRTDTGPGTWSEVIRAVQSDNRNFTAEQNLDAMRLLRMAGGLTTTSDYKEYIEAAGAARRPTEVLSLIDEGKAKGVIQTGAGGEIASGSPLAADVSTAKGARADYVATLPASVRDSRGGASGNVTLANADALLGNQQYAEAEELAGIALTKNVADTERAQMIQAIARVAQGKHDLAMQNLNAITGTRAPLAGLWKLYIGQRTASAQPAATPAG